MLPRLEVCEGSCTDWSLGSRWLLTYLKDCGKRGDLGLFNNLPFKESMKTSKYICSTYKTQTLYRTLMSIVNPAGLQGRLRLLLLLWLPSQRVSPVRLRVQACAGEQPALGDRQNCRKMCSSFKCLNSQRWQAS